MRKCREENKMKLREKGGENLGNEKTKTGDREGEQAEDEMGGDCERLNCFASWQAWIFVVSNLALMTMN